MTRCMAGERRRPERPLYNCDVVALLAANTNQQHRHRQCQIGLLQASTWLKGTLRLQNLATTSDIYAETIADCKTVSETGHESSDIHAESP